MLAYFIGTLPLKVSQILYSTQAINKLETDSRGGHFQNIKTQQESDQISIMITC